VQATTSTKDLDRADIFRPSPIETRYQLHRQGDRRPVRELDPQCVLQSAVATRVAAAQCSLLGARPGLPERNSNAAPFYPFNISFSPRIL